MAKACAKKTFSSTPQELPLYIVSGGDDPVGDYGRGVRKVCDMYKRAGLEPRLKLYEGARHEILNDFCREEATADLLAFIDDCIG